MVLNCNLVPRDVLKKRNKEIDSHHTKSYNNHTKIIQSHIRGKCTEKRYTKNRRRNAVAGSGSGRIATKGIQTGVIRSPQRHDEESARKYRGILNCHDNNHVAYFVLRRSCFRILLYLNVFLLFSGRLCTILNPKSKWNIRSNIRRLVSHWPPNVKSNFALH